jgi:hypothetical protein
VALPDDVVELSPQRLQRRDLGIDLGEVFTSDRIHLAAGPFLLVREAQELASSKALDSPAWCRALWIALAVNAAMFAGEIIAGVAAGSASLRADALDFLGDSANYAISIGVVGMGLAWRARAAFVKGVGLLALGLW